MEQELQGQHIACDWLWVQIGVVSNTVAAEVYADQVRQDLVVVAPVRSGRALGGLRTPGDETAAVRQVWDSWARTARQQISNTTSMQAYAGQQETTVDGRTGERSMLRAAQTAFQVVFAPRSAPELEDRHAPFHWPSHHKLHNKCSSEPQGCHNGSVADVQQSKSAVEWGLLFQSQWRRHSSHCSYTCRRPFVSYLHGRAGIPPYGDRTTPQQSVHVAHE